MTFTYDVRTEGGGGLPQKQTRVLIGFVSVTVCEKFADVRCELSLLGFPMPGMPAILGFCPAALSAAAPIALFLAACRF